MRTVLPGKGIVSRISFSWGTDTFNGSGRLASFMPVNPFYTFTTLKSQGKYFFGAMGLEAQARNPFLFRYDEASNTIEQVVEINIEGATTYDIHRIPTIDCDSSGNIYMAAEELQPNGSGGHGAPIQVWKTQIAGELGSMRKIATIPNRWAYAQIYVNGSTVYVFSRGDNSGNFIRGKIGMAKSTNGGTSFATPVIIYDSGDEDKVAYFQRVQDYSGNLYILINERDNLSPYNHTQAAIIKSVDGGVTWTNLSGSFSKVVGVSGAITRTELRSNCLIYETPTPNTTNVCYEGGVVKSDGSIRICISIQTPTGVTDPSGTGMAETTLNELRYYTYNAGTWSYNLVPIPASMNIYWSADKPTRYINNNAAYDDIVVINVTTRNISVLRSTDSFATSNSTEVLVGSGHSYRMGDMVYNAVDENDYMLIIADPIGNPLLWQNESTTNYTNLKITKPVI